MRSNPALPVPFDLYLDINRVAHDPEVAETVADDNDRGHHDRHADAGHAGGDVHDALQPPVAHPVHLADVEHEGHPLELGQRLGLVRGEPLVNVQKPSRARA